MELNNFNKLGTNGIIVPSPYSQSANPLVKKSDRKWLVVSGAWNAELVNFIDANEIDALCLNSAKGWASRDYQFLSTLNNIKAIDIIAGGENINLESIESMSSLRELSIAASTKCVVDFSKLRKLRTCFLNWWPGAASIFSASWLTDFAIDELKISDAKAISGLTSLRRLALSNTDINSLDFLPAMKELEILELLNCKKINTFSNIATLKALKWLRIDGTKKLKSIQFVSDCEKLEVIDISDCGEIESLRPVEKLIGLKALAFSGNTNVLDGEFLSLTKLPKLSMLMFNSRKHYSHSLTKRWSWNNFDCPDLLLEPK